MLPSRLPSTPATWCLARARCQCTASQAHPTRNAPVTHVAAASPTESSSPLLGRGREVRCESRMCNDGSVGVSTVVEVALGFLLTAEEVMVAAVFTLLPLTRELAAGCVD